MADDVDVKPVSPPSKSLASAAPVVGGVVDAGASIINGVFQYYQNKENIKQQNRVNRENRAFAREMRDYDNWYNSPEQQMLRMRQAGINPALAYMQQPLASAGTIVEGSSSQNKAPQLNLDPTTYANISLMQSQEELNRSAANKNNVEADKGRQDIGFDKELFRLRAEHFELENGLIKADIYKKGVDTAITAFTYDYQLRRIKLENASKLWDVVSVNLGKADVIFSRQKVDAKEFNKWFQEQEGYEVVDTSEKGSFKKDGSNIQWDVNLHIGLNEEESESRDSKNGNIQGKSTKYSQVQNHSKGFALKKMNAASLMGISGKLDANAGGEKYHENNSSSSFGKVLKDNIIDNTGHRNTTSSSNTEYESTAEELRVIVPFLTNDVAYQLLESNAYGIFYDIDKDTMYLYQMSDNESYNTFIMYLSDALIPYLPGYVEYVKKGSDKKFDDSSFFDKLEKLLNKYKD